MSTLDHFIARPAARPRLGMPSLGLRAVLLGGAMAVVLAGLLQVVQTSNVTSTGFTIQRLEQERLDWQARVHQLEAEVASLASLARVEQEARGRLGMVPAETRLYLEINAPVPSQPLLPTRFAPTPEPAESAERSWWQDLLDLLPFF